MRPCFLRRAASSCAELAVSLAQPRKTQCGWVLYGLPRFIHLLRSMTKNFVSADILLRKTSLHFTTDIFSPFVRAKTEKRQRKMRSVFVESGSAFYLWVCDFGEQQAQPVYVHTAIFTCWEHPKPIHKSRKAGREICRNTLILFANRTTIYNE